MRRMTLRNGLVLVVVAALLPIGTLSVVQALSTLDYSRSLIENQLVTSTLATAAHEREPLIIGKQVLLTLSKDKTVRAGGAGCREVLESGLEISPALINLARSDAVGHVQCSVLPFDPSISFAKEAWWQRGIKAKGFTSSAVVIGQISENRVIIGMQPITLANGANDGAVTIAIDASWLERSLEASEIAREAAVAIIDRDGRIVLTSDTRNLPRFDVNSGNTKAAEAKTPDGVGWMYAVAPLHDPELYIVFAQPTDQLMATAVGQVRINLILPIVALLIASLAIWIGTTRLVLRWLESLRLLAAQLAKGNFASEPGKYKHAPREIGLLAADLHSMAQAIQARDIELKSALEAKTVLTHDIHHRVKNNLQIVSSLLALQSSNISDPAAREALNQTRARVGALAQIHRLLYEESHDSDHGLVNIANLLTALCTQLRSLHRGQSIVQLTCDVASQTVPIGSAVPLTLLAVEAVTNAYRHGFPGGQSGTITLHFDVVDNRATLSITDDGNGYDPAPDTVAMGRQLMDAFAFQLHGVLDIASAPGTGTVVTLTYPLIEDLAAVETVPDE